MREPKFLDNLPDDPLRITLNYEDACQDWSTYNSAMDCIDAK